MLDKKTKLAAGLVAIAMVVAFVLGLAESISSGFAGFWGGLPFWIIALAVLALAVYDFWDECIRNWNKDDK
ncbi:MAG: hypothetical protein OXI87_14050 [Albidovulum sp.]|nr:hypothetical protein [Albidovulum sp.]